MIYVVLYYNMAMRKTGKFFSIKTFDDEQSALAFSYNETNQKNVVADVLYHDDEIMYTVRNGKVESETKEEKLPNFFNFVKNYKNDTDFS